MSTALEYAAGTTVSVERTKAELERILRRSGASQYGTATDDAAGSAVVYFRLDGRAIRLKVPLPKEDAFKRDPRGRPLPPQEVVRRHEQACRSRWRGVVLIVKAKLQLIGLELSTVEREFLADVALPDGRSVYELLRPALEEAYASGQMPLLGAGEGNANGKR